jgi:hypothetical protein
MQTTILKKQNDTGNLDIQLGVGQRLNGTIVFIPINLTTAQSCKFTMRAPDNATLTITKRDCQFLDRLTGKVRLVLEAGDLPSVGLCMAECEVVNADGSVRTYPEDGYLCINVLAELA